MALSPWSTYFCQGLASATLLFLSVFTQADMLFVNVGGGPQFNADQNYYMAGMEYEFWQHQRSARQAFSLGAAYTYLHTDQGPNKTLHAFSVYPQLTLTPVSKQFMPIKFGPSTTPYFFVRALGPSYLSKPTIGERKQHNHFSFQASVGVGLRFKRKQHWPSEVRVSFKHFSNANLYDTNDGIDILTVLSVGTQF